MNTNKKYWLRALLHTLIVSLGLSVIVYTIFFLLAYLTPSTSKPFHNTIPGAGAVATTAVMGAMILFLPIIFIVALFTARSRR